MEVTDYHHDPAALSPRRKNSVLLSVRLLGPTSDLDLLAKIILQPPLKIEPQFPRLLAYIVVAILTDISQSLSKRE
jgi:hypothetical protein